MRTRIFGKEIFKQEGTLKPGRVKTGVETERKKAVSQELKSFQLSHLLEEEPKSILVEFLQQSENWD